MQYVRQQARHRMGVFSTAPTHLIHEGASTRILRADGSEDASDLKQASSELMLKFSDIPTLTSGQRTDLLNQMAEQLATQMSQHLFASLDETLQKAGQTVDAKGRKLDGAAVLDALESVQTDFDENGKPSEFTFVTGTALHAAAKAAFEEIESSPTLSKRRNEIYERKRLAWRDREANRKLVG